MCRWLVACGLCGVNMSCIGVYVCEEGVGGDQGCGSGIKSSHRGGGEMVQWAQVTAVKPGDLSSLPTWYLHG